MPQILDRKSAKLPKKRVCIKNYNKGKKLLLELLELELRLYIISSEVIATREVSISKMFPSDCITLYTVIQ